MSGDNVAFIDLAISGSSLRAVEVQLSSLNKVQSELNRLKQNGLNIDKLQSQVTVEINKLSLKHTDYVKTNTHNISEQLKSQCSILQCEQSITEAKRIGSNTIKEITTNNKLISKDLDAQLKSYKDINKESQSQLNTQKEFSKVGSSQGSISGNNKQFDMFATQMRGLAGQFKSLTMTLGPIALAIKILQPVLQKISDFVESSLSPLIETMDVFASNIMESLKPIVDILMPILDDLLLTLLVPVRQLIDLLVPPLVGILKIISPLIALAVEFNTLSMYIKSLSSLFKVLSPAIEAFTGILDGVWQSIQDFINNNAILKRLIGTDADDVKEASKLTEQAILYNKQLEHRDALLKSNRELSNRELEDIKNINAQEKSKRTEWTSDLLKMHELGVKLSKEDLDAVQKYQSVNKAILESKREQLSVGKDLTKAGKDLTKVQREQLVNEIEILQTNLDNISKITAVPEKVNEVLKQTVQRQAKYLRNFYKDMFVSIQNYMLENPIEAKINLLPPAFDNYLKIKDDIEKQRQELELNKWEVDLDFAIEKNGHSGIEQAREEFDKLNKKILADKESLNAVELKQWEKLNGMFDKLIPDEKKRKEYNEAIREAVLEQLDVLREQHNAIKLNNAHAEALEQTYKDLLEMPLIIGKEVNKSIIDIFNENEKIIQEANKKQTEMIDNLWLSNKITTEEYFRRIEILNSNIYKSLENNGAIAKDSFRANLADFVENLEDVRNYVEDDFLSGGFFDVDRTVHNIESAYSVAIVQSQNALRKLREAGQISDAELLEGLKLIEDKYNLLKEQDISKEISKQFEAASKYAVQFAETLSNSMDIYLDTMRSIFKEMSAFNKQQDIDAEYNRRRLQAGVMEYEDYVNSVIEGEKEKLKFQQEANNKQIEARKKMQQEMFKMFLDAIFAELQASAIENIAKSVMKSIGENLLIGIVTGAILTGLITAALNTAKSRLASLAGMKDGGVVKDMGGEGGVDNAIRRLTVGEFIVPKNIYKANQSALDKMLLTGYIDNNNNNKNTEIVLLNDIKTGIDKLNNIEIQRKINIRGDLILDGKEVNSRINYWNKDRRIR